jgi:hypothetical protein
MWEKFLAEAGALDKFTDVPHSLRNGFRIGVSSSITTSSIHPNHASATEMPDVINAHITTEISEGRYSGPFTDAALFSLIGHFRASPLGVTTKPSSPGSFRVIQDFSFPRTTSPVPSVNSEINSEDFSCTWGFFAEVVHIILTLPVSAQAATFDVDAAYRRMPVHPSDQAHIVVGWNNLFWIDHCVPFGAASSNGIFGRCHHEIGVWVITYYMGNKI